MGAKKFRVWDIDCKKMLMPLSVDKDSEYWRFDPDLNILVFNFDARGFKSSGNMVVMQSIGAVDYYYNDIYESDILHVWTEGFSVRSWFEVLYEDGLYMVREIGDEGNYSPFHRAFNNVNYAVCGNIYQDDRSKYEHYRYMLDNKLCNKITLEPKQV